MGFLNDRMNRAQTVLTMDKVKTLITYGKTHLNLYFDIWIYVLCFTIYISEHYNQMY